MHGLNSRLGGPEVQGPPTHAPLGFEDAVAQARARYAATTPESRQVGASNATRWLSTLMGGSGKQDSVSGDAVPRL